MDSNIVTFQDLPPDCVAAILMDVIVDLVHPHLFDLLFLSKKLYFVFNNSLMLFQLLRILFDSEIGKQLSFSLKKKNNDNLRKKISWKFYFKKFYFFYHLQLAQFLFYSETKNFFENKNLINFIKNDYFLSKINSFQMNKVQSFFPTTKIYLSRYLVGFDISSLKSENLKSVLSLNLSLNKIFGISNEINLFSSLKLINFASNHLIYIPPEIGECSELINVDFSNNELKHLPKEISNLHKVKFVDLCHNKITEMPNLDNWEFLTILNLSYNRLKEFPSIGQCKELKQLDLSHNQISSISEYLFDLTSLDELLLHYNKIEIISENLKKLNNLRILSLSHNPLKKFIVSSVPSSLEQFWFTGIEENFFNGEEKKLSFRCLNEIHFTNSNVREIPEGIWCPELEFLDISFTGIKNLSNSVSTCQQLRTIQMDGVILDSIPLNFRLVSGLDGESSLQRKP